MPSVGKTAGPFSAVSAFFRASGADVPSARARIRNPHSEQAMQAQKAVSDTTNELLKKNAELLKQTTVGVAQESERGIVDIETLKHTNQMLIDTLDEVVKIQNDGRAKRKAAEVELMNIETQLKDKMLEFRG